MTASGTFQTCRLSQKMSASRGRADVELARAGFRTWTHNRHFVRLCPFQCVRLCQYNVVLGQMGRTMRRRDLLSILGSAAAAWTFPARAQQPSKMPIIGLLGSKSPDLWKDRLNAFRQGLGEVGYTEGQNVTIEYRWAEGRNERLQALAADLVKQEVSVIVTLGSTPSAIAAKQATATIPIVVRMGSDPVEVGLVASLNRPGGNLTGVTTMGALLAPKQLELLHELMPSVTEFGLLFKSYKSRDHQY